MSTDSCLFGAWVGNKEGHKKLEAYTVLDIGAGTGLLMLMLAQQCNALIEGIEIDKSSYEQALENLKASPWANRLQVYFGDVKEFVFDKKYDLIISNPPFYENDLKSDLANRNVAMHDEGLKLDELIRIAEMNLNTAGKLAVLIPYFRAERFIETANEHNLYLDSRMDVKQTPGHSFFRTMLLLGKKKSESEIQSMVIKDKNNQYSSDFVALLKDYYLYI
ncbi:methyltransferase [Lacibacter sp. MH-610]|uniref:tRNA1(Val) (adenine(37)-N6)-methyltransferase n=1 Tax=Lacibacter sp. MH-610 TaxID=3020883 RepID=UPI003891E434